jgi:hypothetical protein
MNRGLLIVLLALTAGCAQPVSTNVVRDVASGPGGDVIIRGLQNAAYNLDSAVKIGALPAGDPAPACVHDVLQKLGADCRLDPSAEGGTACVVTDPSSVFTPRVSDLISAGSVAYIRIQQLKVAAGGGIKVATSCEAIIGQLLIDQARAAGQVLPGGGLLRILR